MLDFLIFAVCILMLLVASVFFLYPGKPKKLPGSVPGLDPSDKNAGNLADIRKCGSFPEFLSYLHSEFGKVAGFYYGSSQNYVVSVADKLLFRQLLRLQEKPRLMIEDLAAPFFGKEILPYAESVIYQELIDALEQTFKENATSAFYQKSINKKIEKMLNDEFENAAKTKQRLGLEIVLLKFSFEIWLEVCVGSPLTLDDESLYSEFAETFGLCWFDLESRLYEVITEGDAEPDISEMTLKKLESGRQKMRGILSKILQSNRRSERQTSLVNFLDPTKISSADGDKNDDDKIMDLLLFFCFYTFVPTGQMLSWLLYHLADNPDVWSKIQEEINAHFLDDEPTLKLDDFGRLKFTKFVLMENLRSISLIPWTTRLSPSVDYTVDKYVLPPKTPIILALCHVCKDENLFPEADRFDPSRFEEDGSLAENFDCVQSPSINLLHGNFRKNIDNLTCAIATSLLVRLVKRKLTFRLVDPDQSAVPCYDGFVVRPQDEVFIYVEKN